MKEKNDRLAALKKIISSEALGSQGELLEALQNAGFYITQATLSRDLKKLKVAKAATVGGTYVYVLPNDTMYRRVSTHTRILDEGSGVLSLTFSGNLAVLKTRPGYASAVAYDIDNADLTEILGTIAGDDTVVIVLDEATSREQAMLALSTVVPGVALPATMETDKK